MLRQVVQRLAPVANVQIQRNFGVSAPMAQTLDPIQQLFVDKIREYRTKSAGGKLVDANKATEATLNDMLANLERAYGAKGVDMTQFPAFNFTEPKLVWPGLTEEQLAKMREIVEIEEEYEADQEHLDEDGYEMEPVPFKEPRI